MVAWFPDNVQLTQSNCARLYISRNYLQDLLMEVFHNVGICVHHLELRDVSLLLLLRVGLYVLFFIFLLCYFVLTQCFYFLAADADG